MAFAEINGIKVHYEVHGKGPALLMMAPGGFDSTIDKWWKSGNFTVVRPLETFTAKYTCIAYDRREAGRSGGRVERVTWTTYAHEAKGLLEHLGIERAFIMGGCMGCPPALAFGVSYPEDTLGLVLHWPTGGARWRQTGLGRFQAHASFVKERGLDAVVALVREGKTFRDEPRVGPWASVIQADADFARSFASQDVGRYLAQVTLMGRGLFDRDTAPGAEPEDLMALKTPAVIIPGADASHATSAARYLQECLAGSVYHDVAAPQQTPEMVSRWITDFLDANSRVGVA